MSKDNGLSDEADKAIAEAVAIVQEDRLAKRFREWTQGPRTEPPPPEPKPTDPPPKKEDPPAPEPPKAGRSLWWGDRLDEPAPEPPKKEGDPANA